MEETKEKEKLIVSDYARRLKFFRKSIRYSQSEMGEIFGRSQGAYQKYESGFSDIPMEVPGILNQKFKVSFDWFYHGRAPMIEVEKKKNVVRDISAIETEIKHLKSQVEAMKKDIRFLSSAIHKG